ncbi:DUF4240 domain-containing protein [Streptomyces sp. NPDC057638]|uniref:DUF4240 domain-containing protein n=1 Tax=Streptomyces sp. NPDC057638 TaxID=3346190 RepID=UPI0036A31AE8
MDENTFWRLIDDCTPPTPDPEGEELAVALTARLSAGPLEDVIGFAEQLAWMLYQLDRRALGEDLSGDGFLYTRAAVVAAGRDTHAAVLRDPRLFTPYARDLIWAESLLYVPDEAYRRITGEEWDRTTRYSYETCSNTEAW